MRSQFEMKLLFRYASNSSSLHLINSTSQIEKQTKTCSFRMRFRRPIRQTCSLPVPLRGRVEMMIRFLAIDARQKGLVMSPWRPFAHTSGEKSTFVRRDLRTRWGNGIFPIRAVRDGGMGVTNCAMNFVRKIDVEKLKEDSRFSFGRFCKQH